MSILRGDNPVSWSKLSWNYRIEEAQNFLSTFWMQKELIQVKVSEGEGAASVIGRGLLDTHIYISNFFFVLGK